MRDCVVYLGSHNWKLRAVAMIEAVKAEGYALYQIAPTDWQTLERLVGGDRVAFALTVGEHSPESAARQMLAAAGVDTMVLDLGYFRRASGANDETGYNQAGWNRIGWLPEGNLPASRWEALELGIEPPREGTGSPKTVLALGQVEGDSQHGLSGEEMESWLYGAAVRVCREHPPARAKLRPHPKQGWKPRLRWDRVSAGESLEEDLAAADVVITHNSTAGLEALRQGIPVACASRAFYAGVAMQDRETLFRKVAWAQWTIDELRDGTALRFLLEQRNKEGRNESR